MRSKPGTIATILLLLSSYATSAPWKTWTSTNPVRDIIFQSDTIWTTVANGGVVSWVDGKATRHTTESGLSSSNPTGLLVDLQGNVWTGGETLNIWNGSEWRNENIDNSRETPLAVDSSGGVWVKTESGLSVWNGNDWTHHSLSAVSGGAQVFKIVVATNGSVWALNSSSGLSVWNDTTWTFFGSEDGIPSSMLWTLSEGPDGTMWAGTRDSGLVVLDSSGWTSHDVANDLLDLQVTEIAKDIHGNMWVGTANGLGVWDGENWKIYGTVDGLLSNKMIKVVADGQGRIWIASVHDWHHPTETDYHFGLSMWDGEIWTTFTTAEGLPSNRIDEIAPTKDGRIFVVTQLGWIEWTGSEWTSYTDDDGPLSNSITDVVTTSDGLAWIRTVRGVSTFDQTGESWEHFPSLQGLSAGGDNSKMVVDDKDRVFVVGDYATRGVLMWEKGVWTTFDTSDGLPVGEIDKIVFGSDSSIWVANDRTISRWDNPGWTTYYQPIDSEHSIYEMISALDGTIWMTTSGGIKVLSDGEWTRYPNFIFTFFYDLTKSRQIAQTPDGRIWIDLAIDGNPFPVDRGTAYWDGSKWRRDLNPDVYYRGTINDLAVDSYVRLWAATYRRGVMVRNMETGEWTGYAPLLDNYEDNLIWSLTTGDNGLMIATNAWRVNIWDGSGWATYTSADGLSAPGLKRTIVTSDGRIWVTGPGSSLGGGIWTTGSGLSLLVNPKPANNIIVDIRTAPITAIEPLILSAKPNPFNPSTTLSYTVPQNGDVSIVVSNMLGQRVSLLVDGIHTTGQYSVVWDGKDSHGRSVASGVYLVRIVSGAASYTQRVTLIR